MMKHVLSVVVVGGLAPIALAAPVRSYDASVGTLPTDQGWIFEGSASPGLSVAGGVMSYGPTTVAATTIWDADAPDNLMDFSTQTWSLTVDVRLTDATYGNVSGFRRGGFVLFLADDAGNWIAADLGSAALSLRNDNNGVGDPEAAFDFSQEFALVTLEAGPGGGRLLVNGVEQLTLALGADVVVNKASFGELSILAAATLTEIRSAELVPGPATAPVLGAGALALARRRRPAR